MLKSVKYLLMGIGLCFSVSLVAESQDIMVLPLEKGIDGQFRLKVEPTHITQRDGYDNQPKFGPEGQIIYFTRMLDKENGEGQQTDIFRYQLATKELVNITQSDDISEYSATPYDAEHISVVAVNTKGQQHLRLVELATREQQVLRSDIEPVGYYAWLTPTKAGVFVLGDVMTLQLLDSESDAKPLVLAENIGRCFETVAGGIITFTMKKDGLHHLYALNSKGGTSSLEITLPKGVQDYVWFNNKQVIAGDGSKLMMINAAGSKEMADLTELGVTGISRLSLSPDRTKLAIVYDRP